MTSKIDSIKNGLKIVLPIILCFLCTTNSYAGKTETKRLNVGDEFTVYTTYHSYTNSVLWNWDTGVLELVGSLYATSTSATFRVKKATPGVSPVVIQATTYYFKNNTTSSGLNKDLDTWHVYATDNSTVSLNTNSETVSSGDYFTLRATPSNSSYSGSYEWTSTNSNVAYTSGWGNSVSVITKNSGNATIRVTLDNGKYAECYVTVRSVAVSSADVSPSTACIDIDATRSLSLSISPSNASVNSKSWYSTNTTVASVSSSGVVTGKSEGNAEVYCIVNGSVTSSSCYVSVSKPSFTLSSTTPTNNETGQSVLVQPSAIFCRAIYQGTTYSSISLKNSSGKTVSGNSSISGSTITFTPTNPLQANTTYTLSIPANAVKDKYGSYNSTVTRTFTTGDLEKLTLKTSITDKFLSKGDKISLTASKSSAKVYYTLNGSIPTENSTLYTSAITFENDIKLRAIAMGDGYENSEILSMDYYLTNVEVKGRYPDENSQLFVYEDVNPSLTFSNKIEPGDNINNVSVLKNGKDAIEGEVIVADSTIYFIPDEPLELGCSYKVSVPQNAIVTWLGEENDATSWTFNTGDFATAIAMGGEVSTAIKTDGSLLTWGEIYKSGNSADGSYVNESRQTPETFVSGDVASVSAGYMHNAIIKTDGTLWMWGRQYCGEFGNNSTAGSATPVKVMSDVSEVSCGGQSSAIVKTGGSLWMVGRNDFGQIGDSTIVVRKSPVKIMDDVSSAVAGWCSSYAIKNDGTLMAWGRNDNGQLGDGTTDDRWEPTNVMTDVAMVSASQTESQMGAAIKTDGSLWIWGNGNPTPQMVLDNVSSVSAGTDHVVAVKNDGTMWKCSIDKSELFAESITDVACNGSELIALKKDGSVWTGTRTNLSEMKVEGRSSSVLAGMSLNRSSMRIAEGTMSVLVAKPVAINADYSSLVWECSKEEVIEVSERGVITARIIGEADIIATIADDKGNSYTATCHINVVDPNDLDGINDILVQKHSLRAWANNNVLHITGLTVGTQVRVYATNGSLLDSFMAEAAEAERTIRGAGVYIIRSRNESVKVLNR